MLELLTFITKAVIALAAFLKATKFLIKEFVEAKNYLAENIDKVTTETIWGQIMRSNHMKHISFLFIVGTVFAGWAYSDEGNPLRKPQRVGIPPFVNATPTKWMNDRVIAGGSIKFDSYSWNAADKLSEIVSDLSNSEFDIVDIAEIDDSAAEILKSANGRYDSNTQVAFGKLWQADTYVKGTLTSINCKPTPKTEYSAYITKKATVKISIVVKNLERGVKVFTKVFDGTHAALCSKEGNCPPDSDIIEEAIEKVLNKVAKDKKFIASLTKKD